MPSTARTKIPRSRAKTAYGLLSEIAALALEEPKRMWMSIYISRRQDDGLDDDESVWPSCGTVGCIAGWTTLLKTIPPRHGVHDDARLALGLGQAQAYDLFIDPRLTDQQEQGTPTHARAVVAHIRRFQKAHRAQLMATKV